MHSVLTAVLDGELEVVGHWRTAVRLADFDFLEERLAIHVLLGNVSQALSCSIGTLLRARLVVEGLTETRVSAEGRCSSASLQHKEAQAPSCAPSDRP